jgi:hypothetical protein
MVRVLISNTHCLPAAAAAVPVQYFSQIKHISRAQATLCISISTVLAAELKDGATVFHNSSGWGRTNTAPPPLYYLLHSLPMLHLLVRYVQCTICCVAYLAM